MTDKLALVLALVLSFGSCAAGFVRGSGGGGAGASGYFDVDAVLNYGSDWDWNGTDPYIDASVRQQTAHPTTSEAKQWNEADAAEVSLDEITGSVTTLRIWIYGHDYNEEDTLQIDVSADGSTWEGYTTIVFPHGTDSWVSVDFTVSWSGTTDFRLRMNKSATSYENTYIYALYAEANP
jgi:hypothetical protein